MATYGSTDKVRKTAAERYIAPARKRSETTVTIHSGDFNKFLVQNRVLPPNRFPIICNALQSKKFLRENHLTLKEVQGPPSGKSSTVKFIYKIEPLTQLAPASFPISSGKFRRRLPQPPRDHEVRLPETWRRRSLPRPRIRKLG